jgi:hypothetical protein
VGVADVAVGVGGGDVGECYTLLLLNLSVQARFLDMLQWQPDSAKSYSFRDAYQLLISQDSVTLGAAEDLMWHKQVR